MTTRRNHGYWQMARGAAGDFRERRRLSRPAEDVLFSPCGRRRLFLPQLGKEPPGPGRCPGRAAARSRGTLPRTALLQHPPSGRCVVRSRGRPRLVRRRLHPFRPQHGGQDRLRGGAPPCPPGPSARSAAGLGEPPRPHAAPQTAQRPSRRGFRRGIAAAGRDPGRDPARTGSHAHVPAAAAGGFRHGRKLCLRCLPGCAPVRLFRGRR